MRSYHLAFPCPRCGYEIIGALCFSNNEKDGVLVVSLDMFNFNEEECSNCGAVVTIDNVSDACTYETPEDYEEEEDCEESEEEDC